MEPLTIIILVLIILNVIGWIIHKLLQYSLYKDLKKASEINKKRLGL